MKNDLQVVAADVRAIDVGYYNTKYTLGRERNAPTAAIQTGSFPSLARRVDKEAQTFFHGHDGTVVGIKGVDFFVGPSSRQMNGGSAPRVVKTDYAASPEYYALMLGALNAMAQADGAGKDYTVRTLALGLPLSTYHSYSRQVSALMKGVHEIGPSGEEVVRRVVVEDVVVYVQPQGALLHRSAGHRLADITYVIDAGGGTLDWFVADGAVPDWTRCGSYPKAMLDCALAVADNIKRSWRSQYKIMETIDTALRTGAGTFQVLSQDYDLEEHRQAVDGVLDQSVTQMFDMTGPMEDARQIIFTGGGAQLFYKFVASKRPDLVRVMTVDPDPLFSNVCGFQIGGERYGKSTDA